MMHPLRTPFRQLAWLCLGVAVVGARPAAAQFSWTDLLMNEAKEREIAEAEHPKILEQFGGVYDDPALNGFVNALVQHLGRNSDRPDIPYRVTILNSPIVNAFALPAGYLYISRGLLALAGNEAEVAGVLAHEIGHVTARHTAQRYSRGVGATALVVGIGVLGALFDSPQLAQAMQQIAGVGATLYIRGFSRDQEFESDQLGVHTMARSGYDPSAMASFLDRLQGETRLRATLAGKPEATDQFSLLSTHPRTADRVIRAIDLANLAPRGSAQRADDYLRRIDGILYGDDAAQGFVRGTRFVHTKLKLSFEVPDSFRLLNGQTAVTAIGPENASIRFDTAPKPFAGTMQDYLTEVWAKGKELQYLETLDINGFEAATGAVRLKSRQGTEADVRFIAIRFDEDTIYRFLFATPPALTKPLEMDLRRTTYSFRRIDEAEAATYKPRRIRIVSVGPGDTIEGLAAGMPYNDHQVERFVAINGLDPAPPLRPGQLVKTITEDP
jgi:predicted Zn-dependent protease